MDQRWRRQILEGAKPTLEKHPTPNRHLMIVITEQTVYHLLFDLRTHIRYKALDKPLYCPRILGFELDELWKRLRLLHSLNRETYYVPPDMYRSPSHGDID